MSQNKEKYNTANFLVTILLLQCIAYLVAIFDIPVARQIFCFAYFTFVPGFIFVKLLKIYEFEPFVTLLFSVGFSVAFLMLVGLLVNEIFFVFGNLSPLSSWLLMIVFNSLILIGGFIIYLRDRNYESVKHENLELSSACLSFLVLPILSIVGAMWVNVYENNLILLFLIVLMVLLFAAGVFSKKVLPQKLCPLAVFLLGLAILYHSSLISKYLVAFGSDIPVEYFAFKFTRDNAHWSSINPFPADIGYGRINAMLSVTILPTVYSTLLNVDSLCVFKLIIPFIFSFVPVGLYYLWKSYISEKYAFVSVFLFIAQATFYTEMLALTRQMVAELFLTLLLLVLLSKNLTSSNKVLCFVIFSFGLVVSHYALAEIFLLFILVALIYFIVSKRQNKNITVSMAILFFVTMFVWYLFTSNSAVFESFISYGDYVSRQFSDFLNPASRGETVLTGLGLEAAPSIWNMISRIFAYITEALIVIGYISIFKKRAWNQPDNKEIFVFSSIAMAFLAALIIVPGLANTFNMTRFYHVLLFFLAPLFAIGGKEIVKIVFKQEKTLIVSVLLVIVLGAYFLFQTGFVYEVTKSDSWSVSLSKNRLNTLRLYGDLGYVDTFGVSGALWMEKNVNYEKSSTYADIISASNVIRVYGGLFHITLLSNVTPVIHGGVVYLNTLNIISREIHGMAHTWNSSEFSYIFDDMSLIYSNCQCAIFKNTE